MTRVKVRSFPAAIDTGDAALQGDVVLPPDARGIVLFAHGSGSSRFSTRNRYVAESDCGRAGSAPCCSTC